MKDITSQTNSNFSVGLIGPGAVGLFYASFLVKFGLNVTILTRSPERYQDDITIQSDGQSIQFSPYKICSVSAPVDEPFDLLIVATKVFNSIDFVQLINPFMGKDTILFLIQNGVFIEDQFFDHYHQPIMRGLAFLCAVRESYSLVKHLDFGPLTYGMIQGDPQDPKCRQVRSFFDQSEMDAVYTDAINYAIWDKLLWNAAFNPLSVAYGGVDTTFLLSSPEILDRVRHIMAEVCLASELAGYPLATDLIEKKIALTRKMAPYKTSMCLDYEKKLPLELDAILGNMISFCQKNGVNLPYCDELYQQLNQI